MLRIPLWLLKYLKLHASDVVVAPVESFVSFVIEILSGLKLVLWCSTLRTLEILPKKL